MCVSVSVCVCVCYIHVYEPAACMEVSLHACIWNGKDWRLLKSLYFFSKTSPLLVEPSSTRNLIYTHTCLSFLEMCIRILFCSQCIVASVYERWGAGVETQKNVRGEIGGWGRVPFNETYAPSLSTIYDGAEVS